MSISIKWYRSNPDGSKGDEITGAFNEVFPYVSSIDWSVGRILYGKVWVEVSSDEGDFYALAGSEAQTIWGNTPYTFYGPDTIGDITGNEDRYGRLDIVSNDDSSITVTADPNYTLIRDGGHCFIDNTANDGDTYILQIDTVTDNGDGTLKLDTSSDLTGKDFSGSPLFSHNSGDFADGVLFDMWIEVHVTPQTNAPALSDKVNMLVRW